MPDRLFILITIQTGCGFLIRQFALSGQKAFERIQRLRRILNCGNQLHTIAGRKVQDFQHTLNRLQIAQHVALTQTSGKDFFTHAKRRRFMI